VSDVDGNKYIEYGSGLRAVALGHGRREVVAAARRELERGTNFVRPSTVELEAAEAFLETVRGAEMVKFAKNGSDVTTAAVRLARAVTGRPLVAVCREQPLVSTDDWFIGITPMAAGIPHAISELTLAFPYGDLAVTEQLLQKYDGQIACLILEATTQHDPPEEYLPALLELAHRYGTLVIFDEIVNGFRLCASGAQGLFGVTPDLSTFGKALGNGFAVSALAGRRDLMERGGIRHQQERVFLLSTTHGAETHALAAAVAVMRIHEQEDVPAQLRRLGQRLATGVTEVAITAGVGDHLLTRGRPENMVYATLDQELRPSQQYRTLFMRQLILGGVLGPFVVSTALTDDDIDRRRRRCRRLSHGARRRRSAPWLEGRPCAQIDICVIGLSLPWPLRSRPRRTPTTSRLAAADTAQPAATRSMRARQSS
jgi:glutamate-1-semialdehyde 2,1-aminomutase